MKIKNLNDVISIHGLTKIANAMSDKTGESFLPQHIHNWRTRGVPYKWQDDFKSIYKIEKSGMRL